MIPNCEGKRLDAFREIVTILSTESEVNELLDELGCDNGGLIHRTQGASHVLDDAFCGKAILFAGSS